MTERVFYAILSLLFLTASASAQTLRVRHDHDPWGSCEGEVTITDEGIRYETEQEGHGRSWRWRDIQGFDRKSISVFSVLTYEDMAWHIGLDRNYDFTVLPGEEGLSNGGFARIEQGLIRAATDRVPRAVETEYAVAVKHVHLFGGCEGILTFGQDWIVFDTDHAEDARTWRRDRQIANVWSSNPFELDFRIIEEDRRAFDKAKRFTFQLKEPLDSRYYEKLRREFLLRR